MRYKKILVSGGAGFLGSFLVDKLIDKGYQVRILDNLEKQVHQGIKPRYLNKKAKFIKGDVRNYAAFKKALTGIEVVYHLAAAVGVAQSNYEVKKYTDVNIGGTANLVNFLINERHAVKKVIFPASMTGYGEGNYKCSKCDVVRPPVRSEKQLRKKDFSMHCPNCGRIVIPIPTEEEAQEYPSSVYALTKKAQKDLLLLVGNLYKIPTVAIRFFNVYGPRQSLSNPYTGVTAIFISRIKNNKPAIVYEDGNQTRDFLSVHDAVDVLIRAMERKSLDYKLINIGSGKPTPIKEVGAIIAKLLGRSNLLKISYKFRKNDVMHCYADISKAKRLLNFKPKITLKRGLEELVKWSLNEKAEDSFEKAERLLKGKGII